MPTFRLTQSQDKEKKEYKWKLVEKGNEEEIKIVTWKGTYVVDNAKPPVPANVEVDDFRVDQGEYQVGYSHCLPRCFWVVNHKWGLTLVRTWHPLKKCWEDHGYLPAAEDIINDILQCVLAQPPQEEQFHEARVSVESTFVEIESLQKK